MRYLLFTVLALTLSACATRTLYGLHSDSGGDSTKELESDVIVARFAGDAYTSPRDCTGVF